jgi:acyl transferase domain-containing protein/acyl carrier protein
MSAYEELTDNARDIAIIGMAGRFPKANDLDTFWRNLREGKEAISFFSDDELLAAGVAPDVIAHPNYVKAGSILDDVEYFDAGFFGYNPREAEIIDPQQRLFLEHTWQALEHAGYAPGVYKGLIGIYAGVAWNTYLLSNLVSHPRLFETTGAFQVFITNDKDFMPTRVSYKFNLKGPSMIIQTSCSTSLVATHMACLSLLNYECDMALAGGVTVKTPQQAGYFHQEGGMASPDGHCRAFDAQAQGTIFGSGIGIVVLKRLADALDDGDTIHAVIKGSAINNDGSVKVSYTAPSVEGQAEVIAAAQAVANVTPDTISYIEAHGTGTALGDPIEVTALTRVFRAATERTQFCAIGSVKSNLGHLDAAAGVAGLLKTALALKHREIPPSLHFERPNPKIDFATSPFYVNTKLASWETRGGPRRAGVSSFGVGGTNAHVILEEAPPHAPSDPARLWQLLTLSAKTAGALDQATANLAAYLQQHPTANLADVAYTLQVGRQPFPYRRVIVCEQNDDAREALASSAPQHVFSGAPTTEQRPIAFMFSGQGAQYVGMGRALYEHEPGFRAVVDQCCLLLKPHLGLDLRDLLYPENREPRTENREPRTENQELRTENQELRTENREPRTENQELRTENQRTTDDGQRTTDDTRLEQTQYAQPALFVIEYALAQLWMGWGIQPQALIGHSLGEYVAACLAGVFTLEDALALVAARGRLMQSLPAGAMLSVDLPAETMAAQLKPGLSIAAINAPGQCVVSSDIQAITELERELSARGIAGRRLRTSHAFHSAMMDPILDSFTRHVEAARPQPPQIPFISNVSGAWITEAEVTDPHYWARHLRQPVRFADGVGALLTDPTRVLLEVGPGSTLSVLARQHPRLADPQLVLASMRHPQATRDDREVVLQTLGQLWLAGAPVDWAALHAGARRQRIPLPTYPFERQRYWIEPGQIDSAAPQQQTDEKRSNPAEWFYLPAWKPTLLPKAAVADADAQPRRRLIFADASGIGGEIAWRLADAQHAVTVVHADAPFRQISGGYALDPQQPDDYHSLIRELQANDQLPDQIIHCWSVSPQSDTPLDTATFDAAQQTGFFSLIFLAQALAELERDTDTQIVVVSSGAQRVAAEAIQPEKAGILSACSVIQQEHPQLLCRSVDITPPEPGAPATQRVIDQLVAEITTRTTDRIVAYRGGQRLTQRFEPVRLEAAPTGALRERGVYLVTGGLEGIGLIIATHLARIVHARLIITADVSFPAPEVWEHWLADHGEDDAHSRTIRRAQSLIAAGTEVQTLPIDLTDVDQLRVDLAEASAVWGGLHGVVHAAGVQGEQSFRAVQETGYDEAAWHFGPKVYATLALAQVLQEYRPDFCLLASSLASVLGGRGYAAYAASNQFLDAFARYRSAYDPFPWISVGWDAWQDEQADRLPTALHSGVAQFALSSAEAGDVFQRVVAARPAEQIIISTGDLAARIEQWTRQTSGARGPALRRNGVGATLHPRPKLQTPYVAPSTDLERSLASVWQKILGFETIGTLDNFFDLGGDSLIAMRLVKQLKDDLAIELPVVKLYQGLTIDALAQILRDDSGAAQQRAEQLQERKGKMNQRKQYQMMRRSGKGSRREETRG